MWSSQSLCHEELRLLWREKVVHAGTSLIKPGWCMLVCQEMRREPRGTTAIWFRTKYTVGQDAAHDRHPHSCPQTGALNYARKSKMWNKWCSKMWSDVNNNVLRYPVFLNIFIHQVFCNSSHTYTPVAGESTKTFSFQKSKTSIKAYVSVLSCGMLN